MKITTKGAWIDRTMSFPTLYTNMIETTVVLFTQMENFDEIVGVVLHALDENIVGQCFTITKEKVLEQYKPFYGEIQIEQRD